MLRTKVVEKTKIHFVFNKVFSLENRAFYGKMQKNMV